MSLAGPSKTLINIYQPLPQHDIKNERIKLSSAEPFTWRYVETQLSKSRNLDAKNLYETRVKNRKIILENPARESRLKKERLEKKARRTKERERETIQTIRKNEAHLKGLWKLEKEQQQYELFLPLHQLWLGYMAELLGLDQPPPTIPASPAMPNSASMHAKLVKADYHGSILTVRQAKNPCLVGISGIVIHETENAFKLITKLNALKLVPKQGCNFAFQIPLYDARPLLHRPETGKEDTPATAFSLDSVPQMEFELYGNQFRFRSTDRASRKFKAKETIEL